jgi:hypothetical protein
MRRLALIGLTLTLPGCAYVGDPTAGAGSFLRDTHNLQLNPNQPPGNSENMRRARGLEAPPQPLLPEAGDVWPGPIPPEPTLSDLQRQQNQEEELQQQRPPGKPSPVARGSSTPPPSVQPGLPAVEGAPPPLSPAPGQPAPEGRVFQTPTGPVVANPSSNGIQTYNTQKGQGIVIPNGNGTSTLIGPDGSVTTVPNPR